MWMTSYSHLMHVHSSFRFQCISSVYSIPRVINADDSSDENDNSEESDVSIAFLKNYL